MDNPLDNPLTAEGDPLANTVADDLASEPPRLSSDMSYEEFLDWYEGSGMQSQYSSYRAAKGWDEWTGNAAPPYERNEAGRYVNENGEELFYYTGPDYETEYSNGAGLNADADYMTMADIEAKYNEDTVLSNVFDSVEDYKAYIIERQDLIDQGVIMDKWEKDNQLWNDPFFRRQDGRGGPNKDAMADILKAETQRREQAEVDAYAQLNDKYGVETTITDTNGNILVWNGSGYSLKERYKEDDKWGNKLAWAAAGYMLTAGLAPALAGSLGAAGGKAAASAISNLATQFMQNGEVDWESAILSAATSYGGAQLSDALAGSGVVGQLGSQITEFGDSIMSGGGNILQSALQAGGMSLVTQLVKDGEIDWKDAAIAAAIGGGTAALQGFLSDIGKPEAEGDVLEEITVTAQRKGTQVGEGLWQLEDGTVISDTGNVLGNMSNLDLDGDGFLNSNDLQGIDVNHDYVDPTYTPDYGYKLGDDVYVDANGNPVDPSSVKYSLGADGYVDANGNPVTVKPYNEVYGGDKGGLKWEFGLNEDGSVSTTDGAIYYENGELAYEKVNGQWQDAQGNIIDDPTKVDELTMIAAKAIDEPLESVTYFDQDGNPITYKYPPASLQDNYEQGQFSGLIFGPNGEVREVWYDPVTNTEYIKAQGTTEIIAIRNPDEPPQSNQDNTDGDNPTGENNNSSDTGANQDSTATGTSGGGTTTDTGGDGQAGTSGGESTQGGNQESTGEAGSGGNSGGGQTGYPDFSSMTPAEIAAWWAANNGFGASGGGSTGSGAGDNTSGNTTGSGGDGTTTGGNSGAGGESGSGGGGNSTETEGGGGESTTDGGGTGGGTGSGGGDGAGTGGNTDSTGGGDTGTNTGSGTGTGGGSGTDGGTDGTEGGGSGGTSGGGTDGVSGGTGDGSGGGGQGGGGSGGLGNGNGGGMLTGDRTRPTWGPLFPAYQFKKFQYKPPPEPTIGARLFDELFRK